MKICYFGIYHSDFGRNRIYLSGLKKLGVEVVECFDHSAGLKKYWNLVKKHRALKARCFFQPLLAPPQWGEITVRGPILPKS